MEKKHVILIVKYLFMFNDICKYCFVKRNEFEKFTDGNCPERMKAFLQILEVKFNAYQCNIDFLLDELKITKDDLSFITYKFFNAPPKKLLENLRLWHSLRISEEEHNMNVLANKCGYEWISTFRKAFKRRFGFTYEHYKQLISNSPDKAKIINEMVDGLWK
ncbi:MAG: AraC family transcriptional regulator [Bacteroidetes bacterium]|nr:MAG: AraC family transcriptional regulator [Bacteroidota bacterium]